MNTFYYNNLQIIGSLIFQKSFNLFVELLHQLLRIGTQNRTRCKYFVDSTGLELSQGLKQRMKSDLTASREYKCEGTISFFYSNVFYLVFCHLICPAELLKN